MQGNVDKQCKTLISFPYHEFGELQEVSSGRFTKFLEYQLMINSYLQESTIHGIRYWVDGENWLHRIVWMFLVGCSVAFLAFLIKDAYM